MIMQTTGMDMGENAAYGVRKDGYKRRVEK
jgi:hypothetical protein